MKKESLIAILVTVAIFIAATAYIFETPSDTGIKKLSMSNFFSWIPSIDKKSKIKSSTNKNTKSNKNIVAKVVDNLNGVNVYYNGKVSNVYGRAVTKDGYNLGLKYQCVEFVKRYYYEHLNHKMPDSYGHAKEFFDHRLANGEFNSARGLFQYRNKSFNKPKINDLLVFGANQYNSFGHVVIISNVTDDSIEITQQNPGKNNNSRAIIPLLNLDGTWEIRAADILGWLRKA